MGRLLYSVEGTVGMDGGAQYIRSLEFAKLLIPRKLQFGKVRPNVPTQQEQFFLQNKLHVPKTDYLC